MAKRSKAYLEQAAKIDQDNLYSPLEAAKLAKETASSKFDPTVEVAVRLGVDPRKADQMVRGTVNLPHGTGKTARVIVFAAGEKAAEAEAAGADVVGAEDLIERIQGGFLDFDAAIATPDQMAKVGRIARVLGPRGLMPNPKTGTVTTDVTKAVNDIKGGKINFRVDKQANLHFVIGKASFDETKLVENYGAALDEILRAKPSSAKGRYVKKVTVSTTTGPGVQVDPNRTRNLLEDDATAYFRNCERRPVSPGRPAFVVGSCRGSRPRSRERSWPGRCR
jgi:large subunit ribosomal protein L1